MYTLSHFQNKKKTISKNSKTQMSYCQINTWLEKYSMEGIQGIWEPLRVGCIVYAFLSSIFYSLPFI